MVRGPQGDAAHARGPAESSLSTEEQVRAALEQLAQSPEFQPKAPSALADGIQRFLAWLLERLSLGQSDGGVEASDLLLWALGSLIVVAALALLWRLGRRFGEATPRARPSKGTALERPKPQSAQLERAFALHAAGNWREAMGELYAAAVERLASRRLLEFDPAKGAGQYLLELGQADERAGFQSLVGTFQRAVFGAFEPAEGEFLRCHRWASSLTMSGESEATR